MSRDDEAPDPRHTRGSSAGVTVVVVALVLGGLVLIVVVGGTLALFFTARAKNVADVAEQQETVAARQVDVKAEAPERVRAVALKDAVTIDGLTVRVVSVEVGKAKVVRDEKRNLFVEDDERSLLVRIELSAPGTAKKYNYATWRSEKLPAATDDFANTYNVRPIRVGGSPGWVRTAAIGDKVTDTLAFEPPVVEAGHVDLDLPGANAGVAGTFRFRIPREAWAKN